MKLKLSKDALIKAYDELDDLAGIDPPIDKELDDEEFAKELHETVEELVEPDDKFSKSTQKVFDTLKEYFENQEEEPEPEEEEEEEEEKPKKTTKGKGRAKKVEPEPEEEEEEEDEPEPEEEEEEPEEEDELLVDKIAGIDDKKELVSLVRENKDLFKGFKTKDFPTVKKLKKGMIDFLEPAPAPAKKEKKASEKKGTGVIAYIAKLIESADSKKGISKEEMLQKLTKEFPNRAPASMKNTINVQVPNRMSRERFKIKKLENGNFCKE
jgi:hypothetical protein